MAKLLTADGVEQMQLLISGMTHAFKLLGSIIRDETECRTERWRRGKVVQRSGG